MMDILIVSDLDYCELNLVSQAMRATLTTQCSLPEIKIYCNSVTNDYNIKVLDDSKIMFKADDLPHIFSVGKAEKYFYFGINHIEFRAIETAFLGMTYLSENILEFEKLGKCIFKYGAKRVDGTGIKPLELAQAITKSKSWR